MFRSNFGDLNMRFILAVALFISLAGMSHLGYSYSVTSPEGNLPRSLSDGSFEFTVTITGMTATDMPTVNNDTAVAYFKSHASVFIVNSKNTALTYEAGAIENFFIDLVSMAENKSDTSSINIKYSIQIKYSQATSDEPATLTAFVENKSDVKVRVEHKDSSNTIVKSSEIPLTKANYVANEAPQNLTVSGGHKKLTVNWTAVSSVKDQKGTSHSYTGAVLVAIKTSDAFRITAAKEFKDGDDSDDDSGCNFTPSGNGEVCIECDSPNTYLEEHTALNNIPGVKAVSTTKSDAEDISGLENNEKYLVFAFFKPDGIARTRCYLGTPQANCTFTECNGEDPADKLDKKCFIATAAYGSPFAKNVKLFRWFRSTILLKSDIGRKFVQFYYERSPKLAAIIEKNEYLKAVTRGLLWAPAKAIQGFQFLYVQFFANNTSPPSTPPSRG